MRYKNIIQAVDLKAKLEVLNLNSSNAKTASINAKAMCPSIKCQLMQDTVEHYSWLVDELDGETIQSCLELIKFGMSNTLITF